MVLNLSPYYPCLFSGTLTNPTSSTCTPQLQSQLHVCLYVDDFVFYSSDPAQEELFKTLLQEHIKVDFMVNVNYFLGAVFNWLQHENGNISLYLWQSAFTEFTARWFSVHTFNKVPNITPYFSGFPIDSISPFGALYQDLPHFKQVYQSIVGCIKWLAAFACPEFSTALTLLASYKNSPHQQHYKSAIHALNILPALMNMASHSIPSHLQLFITLIIFPIITTKRPT